MRVRAFTESVAVVNDILPAGEIVRRLAREAERALAGETLPELTRKTGVSFGAVKSICGHEAEKKLARRQASRLVQACKEETVRLFA